MASKKTGLSAADADVRWVRALRRDAWARRVILSWRRLTDESAATTLVACSGGGDSVALAVALASAEPESITIGHCLHSMRCREETEGDRDAVRALAERLGVRFVEGVVPAGEGNAEGVARRERYRLLTRMAQDVGAEWVATGHNADDQFETLVMALMRGAGLEGMRGIAGCRRLGEGVRVCRPMLGVGRMEAREFLERAGIGWREDATNADTRRLRSGLRQGPLALIEGMRPGSARRAARSGELMRECALVVQDRVEEVFGEGESWTRESLRNERAIVVGAGLRRCAMRMMGGVGADRLGQGAVGMCVRAIRDASTEQRRFEWSGGIVLEVTAREVWMVRAWD